MSDLGGRRPDTSDGQDMISRNAALEVQVRDIQDRIAKIDFEQRARVLQVRNDSSKIVPQACSSPRISNEPSLVQLKTTLDLVQQALAETRQNFDIKLQSVSKETQHHTKKMSSEPTQTVLLAEVDNILRQTLASTPAALDQLTELLVTFHKYVNDSDRNGEEMLTQIKLLGKLMAEQNEMLKISLGFGSQLRQGQQSPDHVQPMALAHDGWEQFSDKASEIKHPLNIPTRSITLKLKIKEEVHRVQLPGTCVNDLGLRHVSETIEKILPDLGSMYIPKYSDHDGDLCTLTSTSFNDFLTFATENAGDKVLTVHICDEKASLVSKRRDSPQHKPSLFRSLYDLLTMGFAVYRIKILHVQGPESLAERLRSENGDLSVVNTLLLGMVFEVWLMFLGGDLDQIIVYGENQEIAWHYYVYLALLAGSTACLACSVFCSILLSVMLRNILDENVAQFLQDAGLFLRIPYLGCVHGTQVFLASVCFLCFFRVDPMITGIAITGVSVFSVFLVFTGGAKYVQAAYTADFYSSDSK